MELAEAISVLETGYCLWVGAGLTRKIAAGHADVPLWPQITTELEVIAELAATGTGDLPHRLQECCNVIGDDRFQSYLRLRYYTQLCIGVLSQAAECIEADEREPIHGGALERWIPKEMRQVAALGQLANPIVNFNIEPITSILLARPAGPLRILFNEQRGKPSYIWREGSSRFQRLVYHPHGLATHDPIMTSDQYDANRETLAFRLAIHAAFRNTLAIVGMSLDDEYLREQIAEFRSQLGQVLWFKSQFTDESRSWAQRNDITMVRVAEDWKDFWNLWGELPVEIDSTELGIAWYLAVNEAVEEVSGGALSALHRSIATLSAASVPSGLRQVAELLYASGQAAGEPIESAEVRGNDPRDIELALRSRLTAAHVQLPIISRIFDPRV
jgi:hypothetical protein